MYGPALSVTSTPVSEPENEDMLGEVPDTSIVKSLAVKGPPPVTVFMTVNFGCMSDSLITHIGVPPT